MKKPLFIVDIDNSILDTSRRKAIAFMDAVKKLGLYEDNRSFSEIYKAARQSYDFAIMKTPIMTSEKLDEIIFDNFLDNKYLVKNGKVIDTPAKGVVDFLKNVVNKGCNILYLTGRHYTEENNESNIYGGMVKGTLETLDKHKFPLPKYPASSDSNVNIIFKKYRKMKDDVFKKEIVNTVEKNSDIKVFIDDNKGIIKMFDEIYPKIPKIAVMLFHDMKTEDYRCGENNKITCIKEFSNLSVDDSCNILLDGKKLS